MKLIRSADSTRLRIEATIASIDVRSGSLDSDEPCFSSAIAGCIFAGKKRVSVPDSENDKYKFVPVRGRLRLIY